MKHLPSLNALKVFAVAAREGSFTLAAAALHVTQGAVSRQIKQLEDELGVALFVRERQRVELTAVGRELAHTLDGLFAKMETAVRKAAGTPVQRMLRVNIPPTFATRWLAPRLSAFRQRFAHTDLSITTERIQTMRDVRAFDCLIQYGTQGWSAEPGQLLLMERHTMVSSPRLWQGNAPHPLADSTLLHLLDGERRIPVWEQWIATHGPAGLDVAHGLNFSTLDQAINAAIAGAGVVIVDETMVVRELETGQLLRHTPLYLDGPCGYWFVSHPNPACGAAAVAEFQAWLMQELQGQ